MSKNKAEQQADELIHMNFKVPDDLTAPMQAKLANELARQLEARNKIGRIFWYGAAAIVIINALGLALHFAEAKPDRMTQSGGEMPDRNVQSNTNAEQLADYYYTDQLNSY